MMRGFENAKIGDVFDCGATTRRTIVEWMSPRDSAHRVGRVRYLQGLSGCSGSISKGGNTGAGGFRTPKIGNVFDGIFGVHFAIVICRFE